MSDPMNPWGYCPCGHLWLRHDVDEYRGDDSEMCCVEGCDQTKCPGRQPATAETGGETPLQTRLAQYLAKRLLGAELDLMLADHWEFPEMADDILAIVMTWSQQQTAAAKEATGDNAKH